MKLKILILFIANIYAVYNFSMNRSGCNTAQGKTLSIISPEMKDRCTNVKCTGPNSFEFSCFSDQQHKDYKAKTANEKKGHVEALQKAGNLKSSNVTIDVNCASLNLSADGTVACVSYNAKDYKYCISCKREVGKDTSICARCVDKNGNTINNAKVDFVKYALDSKENCPFDFYYSDTEISYQIQLTAPDCISSPIPNPYKGDTKLDTTKEQSYALFSECRDASGSNQCRVTDSQVASCSSCYDGERNTYYNSKVNFNNSPLKTVKQLHSSGFYFVRAGDTLKIRMKK